jgi:hypothetical protein
MESKMGAAFSMPGGDAQVCREARPIDMAHLSRQTMGDRAVENEVLALFVHQALGVRDKIAAASIDDRLAMAHGLKGSARGVGAFAIADCVTDIERNPDDINTLERLGVLIEAVRDFVAAIDR